MQNLIEKTYLPFESPIQDIDNQITELILLSSKKAINYSEEIEKLQIYKIRKLEQIYSNLSEWETVQVARHPQRPSFQDFWSLENRIVDDFKELHGDRFFGDDRAIITGLGKIGREKVMIIGQERGKTIEQRKTCNFGMPHPEGYRKALRVMKIAEKFNLPVISFIDTPGADPGIGAEERGQAQAIAVNLMEMSRLKTPMISVIIGQGGSGGALGIIGQDNVAMLEYAYLSVISPEGCAGILWRDKKYTPEAANALKLTSKYCKKFGIINTIIKEPLGGAHQYAPNYSEVSHNIKSYITNELRELKKMPLDQLLKQRYEKIISVGKDCLKK